MILSNRPAKERLGVADGAMVGFITVSTVEGATVGDDVVGYLLGALVFGSKPIVGVLVLGFKLGVKLGGGKKALVSLVGATAVTGVSCGAKVVFGAEVGLNALAGKAAFLPTDTSTPSIQAISDTSAMPEA